MQRFSWPYTASRMRTAAYAVWLCLSLAGAPAMAAPALPLHAALLKIDTAWITQPHAQHLAALRQAYQQGTAAWPLETGCSAVPVERRDDLFRATALLAFYQPEEALLERMRCLHAALPPQALQEAEHHRPLRGALIELRHFEEANRLRARWAMPVAELPVIRGVPATAGMEVLRLAEPGAVERTALPAAAGWQVIALVHPYCGFSQRAMAAITSDPVHAWLLPYLHLVVPPGRDWPERAMRAWNAQHPALPMQPAMPGAAMARFDLRQTPVFHLLRNGEPIATATGWPGNGEELAALRARITAGAD